MRFLISAWIAGQLFSLFLGDPYKPWDLIISCGVCFAVYLYWQKKKDLQARHLTAYFFSALLIGCMGFMWTQWLTTEKPQPHLAGLIDGRTWVVQGYIDELPRQMDRAVQFGFQVTQWKSLQASQNNTENQVFPKRISLLYPSLDQAQELLPGRYWEFKVQLKPVRGLKNPYGFDLEQWMYIQNFGAQGKILKGSAKRLAGFHHRWSGRRLRPQPGLPVRRAGGFRLRSKPDHAAVWRSGRRGSFAVRAAGSGEFLRLRLAATG